MNDQFGNARIFLLTFLIAGPRTPDEVVEEGIKRGLSQATIYRAAQGYVKRSGRGKSVYWSLLTPDEFIDAGYGANIEPVFDPEFLREVIARVDAADAERDRERSGE